MSLFPSRRYYWSAAAPPPSGMLFLLLLQFQLIVLLLAVVLAVHPGNAFIINHSRVSSTLPITRYGTHFTSLRHQQEHQHYRQRQQQQSLRLNYYFNDNNGIFPREKERGGRKQKSSQLQLFPQTSHDHDDENKQDDPKQDEGKKKNKKKPTTSRRTWDESYKILVEYYKERGDSNLPQNYKKDPKLGRWLQSQRERRNRMSKDKIAKLDSLDFIWDGEVAQKLWGDKKWEEFFQWLVQYKKESGHCNVSTQDEDNKELAYWVVRQRSSKTNSVPSLTPYRIKKLESIGFVWRLKASSKKQSDKWDKQWDEKFEELVMYKKEHGHCNVPRKYKPNQPLADWVHRQREMNAGTSPSGAVRSDRKKRLDEIGFDWDFGEIYDEAWLSMYNKLKELKNVLEGSNLDRQTWASRVDQTELWNWELSQQDLYTRGKLDPQREALLEEIGYWKSIGLIRGRKPDPPKE